jgi:hypothetical protein
MQVQAGTHGRHGFLSSGRKVLLETPQHLLAVGRDTANHPGATHHVDIKKLIGPNVHFELWTDGEGRQFVRPFTQDMYYLSQGKNPQKPLKVGVPTELKLAGEGYEHFNEIVFGQGNAYRARVYSMPRNE